MTGKTTILAIAACAQPGGQNSGMGSESIRRSRRDAMETTVK